jgi:hypothetical protein
MGALAKNIRLAGVKTVLAIDITIRPGRFY